MVVVLYLCIVGYLVFLYFWVCMVCFVFDKEVLGDLFYKLKFVIVCFYFVCLLFEMVLMICVVCVGLKMLMEVDELLF